VIALAEGCALRGRRVPGDELAAGEATHAVWVCRSAGATANPDSLLDARSSRAHALHATMGMVAGAPIAGWI